jgi:excisionase family DNA binding protein
MTPLSTPVLPSPRDAKRARALSTQLEQNPHLPLTDLPESVIAMVGQILEELGQGHAVSLATLPKELTTQEAATLLGVSRPFVVKLTEDGELAYRRVGSHRRIALKELLRYQQRSKVTRADTLGALIADARELGMGY